MPEEYLAALEYIDDTKCVTAALRFILTASSEPDDLFADPETTKRMFERARDNIQHRTTMKQLKCAAARAAPALTAAGPRCTSARPR